tara:strand:- start:15299 stop:15556 length:258 start_codon:yes stop_codon:yes gene_type:complete
MVVVPLRGMHVKWIAFPLALQILFAIVTFVGILQFPKSPRWLIAHDRMEEAKHILWAVEKDAKDLDRDNEVLNRDLVFIQHPVAE